MSGNLRIIAAIVRKDLAVLWPLAVIDQQGDERTERDQATGTNREETARERSHVADILMQRP